MRGQPKPNADSKGSADWASPLIAGSGTAFIGTGRSLCLARRLYTAEGQRLTFRLRARSPALAPIAEVGMFRAPAPRLILHIADPVIGEAFLAQQDPGLSLRAFIRAGRTLHEPPARGRRWAVIPSDESAREADEWDYHDLRLTMRDRTRPQGSREICL